MNEQHYIAEIAALQHLIAGDYDKWQEYSSKAFYTKSWSSIKPVIKIKNKLYLELDIERDIMLLSPDMRVHVIISHLSEVDD